MHEMIGLHHTGVSVPDLDLALEFYCNAMGGEKLDEWSWPAENDLSEQVLEVKNVGGRAAWVRLGKAYLEIFEFNNCEPREKAADDLVINHGLTHLAFLVEDLDAWITQLKGKRVRFHNVPIAPGNGSKYVYARDPFGNVIELMEITETDYQLPNNYLEEVSKRGGFQPANND